MTTKFDEAFAKVQRLVAIFESGKDHYLSGDYQEADARKDFVDKFFTALGWDVNHDVQTNPYAQEVKVERGVNEGSARKRADYAFFLKPNFRDVRFYVEAKRPSKDFGSADNCLQAIRYGWFTKKTSPFAVLTSFEDFYILDCRLKPNINSTLASIVERFSYTDYVDPEKFARIYWLFSREAVADGSLEKFADNRPVSKTKRYQRGLFKGGDTQPDEDFLEELDGYRQQLATAFKDANPDLDGETLTEVTQRTLDRLVFTRFLEDKGIESPVIENFGKTNGVWEDFIAASLRLNRKYNGVVYKEHPKLDAPGFKPDEKVFARICEELTDPSSPYNFNVIPIHILGSIYERFLGKVISNAARVVEKPEVRKAGGVYYTPEYIVRYIVENTVGKMIEGKTPEMISKLKFADIACGSGSFLLGVYDVLLKYHAEYYSKNPGKVRKGDCVRRDGTLHLSLQKKRDILTNNLYGVDIDRQAVEVAQLSLYLKLLEDETVGTTSEFQDEFHFTLLPSLDNNIVCGNSLIGPDIAAGGALTDEEEKRINPLDYAQRFPTIFRRKISGIELREAAPGDVPHHVPGGEPLHGSYAKVSYQKKKGDKPAPPVMAESEYEGGFDAIVGNPPYVRIQGFPRLQLEYFSNHYQSACGNFDLYVNFIERGYKILKAGGLLGQIVPNKFFKTDYGEGLRQFIITNAALENVVDFGASQVFDATTYTCLLFLTKETHPKFFYALSEANPKSLTNLHFNDFLFEKLTPKSWTFGVKGANFILDKIKKDSVRLIDLPVEISRGSSTGNDDVFMVDTIGCNLEPAVLRVPLFASDFSRYNFQPADKWRVIFPYKVGNGKSELMAEKEFQKFYPKAFEVLRSRKGALLKRKQFSKWFGYSAPRNLPVHERAQICIPLLADRGSFTLIPPNTRGTLCPMASGGFTIALNNSIKLKPEYILGLLNSTLLFWQLRQISNVFRGGWITCTKQYFGELPIRTIDFSAAVDKSRHDRLVELVEEMLAAKAKLPTAKTDRDREFYTNKCATLDQQIDALVYELYDLTSEEIKLVEGGQ